MSYLKIDASGILPLIARIGPASDKVKNAVALDVARSTEKYVPKLTGSQRRRTRVVDGKVIYEGPYARYLYLGKVVEGPLHGPKHATDKDLKYSEPGTTSHWFEESKKENIKAWKETAKETFLRYVKK